MVRKLRYNLTNLRGMQCGDLQVLHRVASRKKRPHWKVQCICGRQVIVAHNRLIDKKRPKTHCGCKRKGPSVLHPKEYHAWWDAKGRCHNPKHPSYPRYGAKGVRMDEAWRKSFPTFLTYIGDRPSEDHSLDRINASGHYEPGNVRWATGKVQARNKRGTKYVQHPTTRKPIAAADLAEELGVTYRQLRNRLISEGKWYNDE